MYFPAQIHNGSVGSWGILHVTGGPLWAAVEYEDFWSSVSDKNAIT